MFCDPFLIGRVLGHTGKQQEDAASSTLRQDSVYPARDPLGLIMHLSSQVIEEMQWWHDKMHQWSGKVW
jgi:hypothetical protein